MSRDYDIKDILDECLRIAKVRDPEIASRYRSLTSDPAEYHSKLEEFIETHPALKVGGLAALVDLQVKAVASHHVDLHKKEHSAEDLRSLDSQKSILLGLITKLEYSSMKLNKNVGALIADYFERVKVLLLEESPEQTILPDAKMLLKPWLDYALRKDFVPSKAPVFVAPPEISLHNDPLYVFSHPAGDPDLVENLFYYIGSLRSVCLGDFVWDTQDIGMAVEKIMKRSTISFLGAYELAYRRREENIRLAAEVRRGYPKSFILNKLQIASDSIQIAEINCEDFNFGRYLDTLVSRLVIDLDGKKVGFTYGSLLDPENIYDDGVFLTTLSENMVPVQHKKNLLDIHFAAMQKAGITRLFVGSASEPAIWTRSCYDPTPFNYHEGELAVQLSSEPCIISPGWLKKKVGKPTIALYDPKEDVIKIEVFDTARVVSRFMGN